ncbi:hypothetical protein SLEP1_g55164 [Rubroshorea leprosula]|uniref:Leucine-rich repeat-containing N-terminal plant-type domain-containing protein n=1 Tax=Rubroshorea leprosula TaxID=152421 RepID=A0AAV5MIQ1_9ROSI|nr:hypothetical protein SLEP1_g55164 [Rubroshorea leprosula]
MRRTFRAMLVLVVVLFFGAAEFCSGRNTSFSCIEREREALLKFKLCFHDPSYMLSSWKGSNCCEWKGIGCDKNSGYVILLQLKGSIFDQLLRYSIDDQQPHQLHLIDDVEEVVSSLLKLRYLEHLDLSQNNFNGNLIPPSFGLMKQLRYLNLSSMNFKRRIPGELRNLTRLRVLDLSDEHYGRLKVDDVQWISHLFSLQQLEMSGVNLSHASSNLFQLESIDLAGNQLSGSIPDSIGQLSKLESIYLSGNQFGIRFPEWLLLPKTISVIDLSNVNMSGPLPENIGHMIPVLQALHLTNNLMNGSIPKSLCNSKSLTHLDLSNNMFSGSIPNCWRNDQSFTFIDLSSNNLSDNNLIGRIPPCFGKFPIMVNATQLINAMDLAYWYWTHLMMVVKGRYLEYTGKTLGLECSIDLSSNNLIESIPEELIFLKDLHNLNLSWNHLLGTIPEKIGQMENLESLDFSQNGLSGMIPKSMSNLTKLSHLNLSYNNLLGPIPTGYQLQTLEDPTIYIGNPQLCGAPLLKKCSNDVLPPITSTFKDNNEGALKRMWFYIIVMSGFAIGFWGVVGTLIFVKSWRYAYFQWVDDVKHWILMVITLKVARFKKMFNGNLDD